MLREYFQLKNHQLPNKQEYLEKLEKQIREEALANATFKKHKKLKRRQQIQEIDSIGEMGIMNT